MGKNVKNCALESHHGFHYCVKEFDVEQHDTYVSFQGFLIFFHFKIPTFFLVAAATPLCFYNKHMNDSIITSLGSVSA